jgi:hypothetical protein
MPEQFHTLRKFSHCMQSVVAMGYESAGCGGTDLARPRAYGGE